MKIVFAGTPDFAVSALQALVAAGHEIVAVYTQPDRPSGRGRKLAPSPVKQCALERQIPVFQPNTLKDPEAQQELAGLGGDIMVVVAYGLILPKAVLDTPKYGCLNIHASILPRWRGAAPIQRAVLAGDPVSGVTIMQMDEGLDTGAMLYKVECPINDKLTGGQLHDRLAAMGGEAIVATLKQVEDGSLKPESQDDSLATYASKLDKTEARIDWSQSALDIDRQVRAFNPWPVAQTQWGDKVMRVWQAELLDEKTTAAPGTVIASSKDGIDVATGEGILRLQSIQLPGKKAMDAAAFLNAHSIEGDVLG